MENQQKEENMAKITSENFTAKGMTVKEFVSTLLKCGQFLNSVCDAAQWGDFEDESDRDAILMGVSMAMMFFQLSESRFASVIHGVSIKLEKELEEERKAEESKQRENLIRGFGVGLEGDKE